MFPFLLQTLPPIAIQKEQRDHRDEERGKQGETDFGFLLRVRTGGEGQNNCSPRLEFQYQGFPLDYQVLIA